MEPQSVINTVAVFDGSRIGITTPDVRGTTLEDFRDEESISLVRGNCQSSGLGPMRVCMDRPPGSFPGSSSYSAPERETHRLVTEAHKQFQRLYDRSSEQKRKPLVLMEKRLVDEAGAKIKSVVKSAPGGSQDMGA